MQITPGEEGFFAIGSGLEENDPSGVPSNVQAAGRCATGAHFAGFSLIDSFGQIMRSRAAHPFMSSRSVTS